MWDDVEIVTVDQLKVHLRLTGTTEHDDDLTMKLEEAHALVLDYVRRPADADFTATMLDWTEDTAPKAIRAAIFRQAADLFRFRGDDPDDRNVNGHFLSPRVQQLLNLYREHVIA